MVNKIELSDPKRSSVVGIFVVSALVSFLLLSAVIYTGISPLVILAFPASVLISWAMLKNAEIGLYAMMATMLSVSMKPRGASLPIIDIIAGIVILGITISTIISVKFLHQKRLFSSPLQYWAIAYYLWTLGIGMLGMILWGIRPEFWLREALLQLPILLLPVQMALALKLGTSSIDRFLKAVIVMWFFTIIFNIIAFRQNVVNAFYLFETGRSSLEISISSLALLAFFSLSAIVHANKQRLLLIGGILFSSIAISISLFRTIWLTNIILIPILLILMYRSERKRSIRFILLVSLIIIGFLAVSATQIPLVGLLLKSFYQRFLYSSAVTTDPSLINRYIEWARVLVGVLRSPIIGMGYGATYLDYNWLLGYSYWYGFTHNGYLYLLLKSGIIGTLLIGISYIRFLFKGLSFTRSQKLTDSERALLRAGCVFLVGILFINITLNSLAQRDAIFWIGIIWGYILLTEQKITLHTENSVLSQ